MAAIYGTNGQVFMITDDQMAHSKVLRRMKDDIGDDDDGVVDLYLDTISDAVLAHVTSYMRTADTFDSGSIPAMHLMEVLEAANYLDMPVFANIVARRAADFIRLGRIDLLKAEDGELAPTSTHGP